MSVPHLRIFSGLGAVCATAVGIYFGLSKKQEADRINHYKTVETKVKQILSKGDYAKNKLTILSPDDPRWEKGRAKLMQYRKEDMEAFFDEETRNDTNKFRDYCFEHMDKGVEDLKENKGDTILNHILETYGSVEGVKNDQKFWRACVLNEQEVSQLG